MPKYLVDFKVIWKILTGLYCFQSAHSQTIPHFSMFLSLFKREKVHSTSAVLWGHAVTVQTQWHCIATVLFTSFVLVLQSLQIGID